MPTDPFLAHRIRRAEPSLRPRQRRFAELERRELLTELDSLDAELETLAARRRIVTHRLVELRDRLWPRRDERHARRRPALDRPPLPPVIDDAVPLGGPELRGACLVVLRRHGPLDLRTLHGLLHRYGFVIVSKRPVQRLADALAYEVQEGRAHRVARGVYGAAERRRRSGGGASGPDPERQVQVPAEPLPWRHEDEAGLEPAQVDARLRWDPSRWAPTGSWDGVVGVEELPTVVGVEAAGEIALARARFATLLPRLPVGRLGADSPANRRVDPSLFEQGSDEGPPTDGA